MPKRLGSGRLGTRFSEAMSLLYKAAEESKQWPLAAKRSIIEVHHTQGPDGLPGTRAMAGKVPAQQACAEPADGVLTRCDGRDRQLTGQM